MENEGISRADIHIESNQKTAGAGSSVAEDTEHHRSGFLGWWDSLFGNEDTYGERRGYEDALASGRAILRATVPETSLDRVVTILNERGAVDVNRRSGMETGIENTRTAGTTRNEAPNAPIQVVEEELQIGKRAVQRGGVRIYSHVIDQPVEQQIRLTEEHVNVERRPVNREVNPADLPELRDQTIEVREMAEEPVVAKRARVREEIVVDKETTERTETVRDSVRRTEVDVEKLDDRTPPRR